jgi:hypothetical protein
MAAAGGLRLDSFESGGRPLVGDYSIRFALTAC